MKSIFLPLTILTVLFSGCFPTRQTHESQLKEGNVLTVLDTQSDHVYLPIVINGAVSDDSSGDDFSWDIELMPVYNVIRISTSEEAGQRLANALQLPANPFDHDGVLRYMDQERFQYIPQTYIGEGEPDEEGKPTALYATDMEALRETTVIGDEEAMALANEALERAELSYFGATSHIRAATTVDHSRFQARAVDGSEEFTVMLDTQVLYDFTLDDVPLVGPGAKVKLVFDGEGVATQVFYAMRDLQPGEMVPIVPISQGDQLCRDAYLGSSGASEEFFTLQTWSKLVYYAPELGMSSVTRIFPQYICGGKATLTGPNLESPIEYEVPTIFVPAVEDVPRVSLSVVAQGDQVNARTEVSGGMPPYTFVWSSANTSLDPDQMLGVGEIQYTVLGREEVSSETVGVTVTDANGLKAWTTQTVAVSAFRTLDTISVKSGSYGYSSPPRVNGPTDVIVTYVGLTANPILPDTPANARGFVQNILGTIPGKTRPIPGMKFYGERAVWERDFRDKTLKFGNSITGWDYMWYDNADMVYHISHGQEIGLSLSSQTDFPFFFFNLARWGDGDMEWFASGACLTLFDAYRNNNMNIIFNGLHILLGFISPGSDNSIQGSKFAEYMVLRQPAWKIINAWQQSATDMGVKRVPLDGQLRWIQWGAFFPMRTDYVSNYNDYFHDVGPVGPDIIQNIRYFCIVWGPV